MPICVHFLNEITLEWCSNDERLMTKNREEVVTLEILEAIEGRSDVTQRHLADRLGVALGLANSYLKRCVRKGFIKITQAPANRYLYYLTPHGFAEKSRLTTAYLAYSFAFYREASESMTAALQQCVEVNVRRVLFAGVSELAEIGSVRAHDFNLAVVGTYDPASVVPRFIGKPVWRQLDDALPAEAAIFTALAPADTMYLSLLARYGAQRVLVPGIVRPLAVTAQAQD